MAKAAKYLSFSAQPVSLPSDLDSFRLAMLKKRSLQASNLTDGTRYQVPLQTAETTIEAGTPLMWWHRLFIYKCDHTLRHSQYPTIKFNK